MNLLWEWARNIGGVLLLLAGFVVSLVGIAHLFMWATDIITNALGVKRYWHEYVWLRLREDRKQAERSGE